MVPALLVHRAYMRPQVARLPKRVGAVRALVVPALLVHQAHMPLQVTRVFERSGAVGARVRPGVGCGALLFEPAPPRGISIEDRELV